MAVDFRKPRWQNALLILDTLPIEEKRRFYAQAVKFLLDARHWNDPLRNPSSADHPNMRDMINAFNSATGSSMREKIAIDIRCQWEIVKPIRRGKKRRTRKRQISRLTYEMMYLIRLKHPTGVVKQSTKRQRVKGMSSFQRQVKQTFLGSKRFDNNSE